jgi:CRISPR/Cas system-associated exonuclease Cas4 (RecB family)
VSLENKLPGEIRKTKEIVSFLKNFSYSPTALDSYLKCPLLFYYRYVLGIEKKEEVTETLERMDIGKFVHGVLSAYFGKRRGVLLKDQDISLKEMGSLIDGRFEMEYGKDPVGSAYLLKRQIKDHLEDFLKYYTLPLIREVPVTVLQVEESVRAEKNGFRLKGRLDHIEKRGEKTVIVDYKTSSGPTYLRIRFDRLDPERRETWDEAIGSLQLPLYLLLYSEASGKRVEELDGMFLLLGRKSLSREIEHSLFADLDDPGQKFEQLKTVIFSLLNEIVDPSQPFRPSSDVKGECPSCDFKNLCGTQWVI